MEPPLCISPPARVTTVSWSACCCWGPECCGTTGVGRLCTTPRRTENW
ncbi:hypothetical protein AOLI_G00299010, partial [Acnodon oligacanthus]